MQDASQHKQNNDIFGEVLLCIHNEYQDCDRLISKELIENPSGNVEQAIEHAIALIPQFLFTIYGLLYPQFTTEKDNNNDYRKFFCFCINYNSLLYPNHRFHLHLSDNSELKTFCFKKDVISYDVTPLDTLLYDTEDDDTEDDLLDDVTPLDILYDTESPFVELLNLFYDNLGKTTNEFSMNRFLSDYFDTHGRYLSFLSLDDDFPGMNPIERGWFWLLDEKDYTPRWLNIVKYLEDCTYGYYYHEKDFDYTNYAAFLLAASGTTYQENDYPDNYLKKFPAKSWLALREDSPAKSFRQYNIPILGLNDNASDSRRPQKVIGNLMIPSLVEIDPYVLAVFHEKTSDLLNKISHYEKIVLAQKAAVRSTIAQVMARNLSHNYGSHVLNHLLRATLDTFTFRNSPYKSQYYGTLGSEAKKKELYWQIIYLIRQLDDELKAIKEIKEVDDKVVDKLWEAIQGVSPEQPENLTNESLRQVVYLLNHIKCRIDYISDISFGAPTIQISRRVYGDIFKELDRVSLLMNHISGLEEQFKYNIILNGPNGKLDQNNDIQVAVPNDVVGTQAFYNILENIIRNTAKHSNKTRKSGLVTFHIDFSEVTSKGDWEETLKEEAQYYYCVEIYDNLPMDNTAAEELVNAQNERLNDPIFEGERPRSHSLGLVEMEASAAYLRKLDSSVIDDERYHVINRTQNPRLYNAHKDLYYNQYNQFNLLKAIKKPTGNGTYHFGYRFFMLRPQEVLMVVDDDQEYMPLHNPKEGVWIVAKDKFRQTLNDGKVFNHEFVVYEGEDVEELIGGHKMALSPRVLQRSIKNWLDNNASPKDIIEACWQQWHEENTKKWKYSKFNTGYNGDDAVYLDHMGTDTTSFGDADYCEALSSNAQKKLPEFHHNNISGYLLSFHKDQEKETRNLESVNNKVLIVDERIQDAAEKQKEYGQLLKEHYKKMNVTMPELSNLNLLETDISKVARSIKDYIEQNSPSYDFVMIHYGILERIFKSEDIKHWKDNLDKYLEKLSKTGSRIILTSGRGVPSGMPSCLGFVSLSSVTAALIDYKSKYLLNCLMYAARKTAK